MSAEHRSGFCWWLHLPGLQAVHLNKVSLFLHQYILDLFTTLWPFYSSTPSRPQIQTALESRPQNESCRATSQAHTHSVPSPAQRAHCILVVTHLSGTCENSSAVPAEPERLSKAKSPNNVNYLTESILDFLAFSETGFLLYSHPIKNLWQSR